MRAIINDVLVAFVITRRPIGLFGLALLLHNSMGSVTAMPQHAQMFCTAGKS